MQASEIKTSKNINVKGLSLDTIQFKIFKTWNMIWTAKMKFVRFIYKLDVFLLDTVHR